MSNSAPTSSAAIALEEKPAATITNTEWNQVGNCSCLDQVKATPGSATDPGSKPA